MACPLTGNPYGDHESRESLLIPAVAGTVVSNGDAHSGFRDERGIIPAVAKCLGASPTATGHLDPSQQTFLPAVAGCLQERDAKDADSDTKPGHLVPMAFKPSHFTRGKDGAPSSVVAPLSADADKGDQESVVAQVQWASGGGKVLNPTAQALRSGAEHNYQFAQVGMQVRRLTPTECARLQGFPDDWLDDLGFSDSTKYKCLGNAVCVNVAEWIAWRMAKEMVE